MSSVVISGDTSGAVTISAPAVAGTTTLTLPATSGTILQSGTTVTEAQGGTGTSTGYYGFKNRIINGAMVIDQRNAGAVTTPTDGSYSLDRWVAGLSQASKFTIRQTPSATETGFAVRVAAGFTNYLACTVGASANVTLGASDVFAIQQKIEGFNFADMAWGTAAAKTVTLSFLAYSSVTGTFGGAFVNSANNRSYPFTYSIPTANTWTTISVTIAGDTSGTWLTTNGRGMYVRFGFGVGSTYSGTAGSWASAQYFSATGATSVVGTSGATFYITGVQLEEGTTATSFERESYSVTLQKCQRYYWQQTGIASTVTTVGSGMVYASTDVRCTVQNPVTMRTTPTVTFPGSAFEYERPNTSRGTLASMNSTGRSAESSTFYSGSGTTAGTAGDGAIWYLTNSGTSIGVSAEL